jgi:hypothetical protein
MKRLNTKNIRLASAFLKFRELYIKTEIRQINAKAQLAINKSVSENLKESENSKSEKEILNLRKEEADKTLMNIIYQKKYLSNYVNILALKFIKNK